MTRTQQLQETYSEMICNPNDFDQKDIEMMIGKLRVEGDENAASKLADALVESNLSGSPQY